MKYIKFLLILSVSIMGEVLSVNTAQDKKSHEWHGSELPKSLRSSYVVDPLIDPNPEFFNNAHKTYDSVMTSVPVFHWVKNDQDLEKNTEVITKSIRTHGLLTPQDQTKKQLSDYKCLSLSYPTRYKHTFLFPDAESAVKYGKECFNINKDSIVTALIPHNADVHALPLSYEVKFNNDDEYITLPRSEWKEIENKNNSSLNKLKEAEDYAFLHNPFFTKMQQKPIFNKKENSKEELDRAMQEGYITFPEVRSRSYGPEEIDIQTVEIPRTSHPEDSPEYEEEIIQKITSSPETIKRLKRATIKAGLLKGYK